jgi:hypothetical protein
MIGLKKRQQPFRTSLDVAFARRGRRADRGDLGSSFGETPRKVGQG